MRYAYVLNPQARSGRAARLWPALDAALQAAGVGGTMRQTTAPGDAVGLAHDLAADADVVVAVGGDGTVHEVVNGLVGTGAALGVLPVGTGNDFARALGMPRGVPEMVARLAATAPRPLDVGRLAWEGERDGVAASGERWVANAVGVGFDALAALGAARTKWLGGRSGYTAAVLRALWASRTPGPAVTVDVETPGLAPTRLLDGPLYLCEIGNGPSVGGGFFLTPDARLDDGRFDVCAVRHLPPSRALRLLPTVFSGTHVGLPEVTMGHATRVVVTAPTPCLPVHADGEGLTLSARRVEVTLVPGGLDVVAPGLPASTVGGA